MIQNQLCTEKDGKITHLEVTGHADYAAYGKGSCLCRCKFNRIRTYAMHWMRLPDMKYQIR